jgi:glycosyltransferase involved in cell wall biosynthesis
MGAFAAAKMATRRQDNSVAEGAKGRPPAILQVIPSLVSGGAERGTVEIAAALAASGWTAYVASSGGPMEHQLARVGAHHIRLPLASKNPLIIRRNAGALKEIIRRHRIDIVHARSRAPAWSALWAARATRRRFVTTFHNAYDTDLPLKRWYNSVMARGDRVIAISQFVGAHAAATYGIGPDRLRIIPRGVDLAAFDPDRVRGDRVAALARQWRVPDEARVVMLPGRLTRWKGGLEFIEAAARLGRRDLCCLLVGAEQRAGFRRELEAAIGRLGLMGMFRIVDHCADMPAAYMLSDVVVSASNEPEGFGRVIIEAQAMGRPVIATDHGGARETILPGSTGWLAKPGDPASLAEAIGVALALDPEARSAFARRAMAHIATGFTSELMCTRTLTVYEELLFPQTAAAVDRETGERLAIPA